ncbi:hypothetical protein [Arthrobacter bambusae]|uniref:Uncharacterized protein n=1 Tax=Arthrobacter bambusae TaxID=1338426 RepID=A0AAW8DHQ0_9MICC|nr:hypothetical protein [Arthrobacter bambusae]MDP9904694.1 hypothetical protein [Arthrobacter bambusae]MDQ0129510.1 hypothetical protein [Arthrobacter bambusae]MDQ0180877.1 hypothetical protein [Arthrobacter bambusae]
MSEQVDVELPVSGKTAAARILAERFPQIVDFDAAGMTTEEIHYFLGESAGVAFFQFRALERAR